MIKYVILLCFTFSNAFAGNNESVVSLRDFSGGYNDSVAPIALKPNESPGLLNVVIDDPVGSLKTRNGYLACGSIPSGNTITSVYEYAKSDGSHNLILTDNVSVYQTADCVSFSTVATGFSSTALIYFDTFRDKLWITNKSTDVITWDGTTATNLNGTGTLPDPPLGQYITHWKERVWLARTTTEPSAIYYSELTDSAGNNIDPSVSSQAWPTTNAFYIAQDDGSPVYGIKVYKDCLYVFKRTGIWRIVFESDFETQLSQMVSNVGSKFQDSIVELDNLLYFVGEDGVYKFDGNDAVRISDNIETIFKSLKQPTGNDKFVLWNTPTDWLTGSLSNVSTSIYSGSISLDIAVTTVTYDKFSDGDYTASPVWTFLTGVGGTNNFSVSSNRLQYANNMTGTTPISGTVYTNTGSVSTNTFTYGNYYLMLQAQSIEAYRGYDANGNGMHDLTYTTATFHFLSDNVNPTLGDSYAISFFSGDTAYTNARTASLSLIRYDAGTATTVATSSCSTTDSTLSSYGYSASTGVVLSIRVHQGGMEVVGDICYSTLTETTPITQLRKNLMGFSSAVTGTCYKQANGIITTPFPVPCTSASSDFYGAPITSIDSIHIASSTYQTSGSWTSAITTYTSLSEWSTFDVDETLNGRTITYTGRSSSTVAGVLATSYTSLIPGTLASSSNTATYFQWKAALATTNTNVTPLLNSGITNYKEGGVSSERLAAVNYDNRYYLVGSTTSSHGYNDVVMVKSKYPLDTWTIYDWTVSAFTKWNNLLYGGVSNTANVYRFDYGTSDNGTAINAYWEWGDQHWPKGLAYKHSLSEMYLYYVPTSNSVGTTLSYSYDGGTTWANKTANLTGTAKFGLKRILVNGGIGNAFRFKIANNSVDQTFNIYGLDVWADPYMNRE